jgi:GxxExxY protein
MSKIIFPELSYKIMGILFTVHNELGSGYMEKHYQRAVKEHFIGKGIHFKEQNKIFLGKDGSIGRYYIDFVIENEIVLGIKAAPRFSRINIIQVLRYLKETDLELGILANFARKELIYRRILRGFKDYA